MEKYDLFDIKHTGTEYRKLVLFVVSADCRSNRLPYTVPTIVDNDANVVYGVICYHLFPMSNDTMAEYHTFLNSTLQCMDFAVEVVVPNGKCTIKEYESKIAAIAVDMAKNSFRPDHISDNVRLIHNKCGSVKFSNAVVVEIGNCLNIADAINRNSPPSNVKTLLLNIGLYPREWSSYYFDLLGLNGNCGAGYTRHLDFCQYFVDTHLDRIRECLKLLLTDNPDLPKSTFTDDIEPFIMYTGH